MRVLVVDDAPIVCAVMRDVLVAAGHIVEVAHDWIEMFDQLSLARFDAVFLDVGLPGVPGTSLVCQVCGISETTRVILMSGMPHTQLAQLARTCGADGAFSKDDGPAQAPSVLASICREAAASPGPPEVPRPVLPVPDADLRHGRRPPACPIPPAPVAGVPPAPEVRGAHGPPDADPVLPPWCPENLGVGGWLPDVVLVDGDPKRRPMLEEWLYERGFGIYASDDASDGWAYLAAASEVPDLLLLDAEAPGLPTEELLTKIRQRCSLRSLTVILLEPEGWGPVASGRDGRGVDQVLRGPRGLQRLPSFLADRIRMMHWLRRLRIARSHLEPSDIVSSAPPRPRDR